MKPNSIRVLFGGIAAGLIINAIELLFHRVLLDKQWTAAFAALGKKPTGWTTFIPSNLLLGVLGELRFSPSKRRVMPLEIAGVQFWLPFSLGRSCEVQRNASRVPVWVIAGRGDNCCANTETERRCRLR